MNFRTTNKPIPKGLEFDGERLYESTGLKGKSSLRRVNYKTGAIEKQIDLDASLFRGGANADQW